MATDPQTGEKGQRTVAALIRNTGPHLMVAVGTNKAGVENTTSDTIDATDNHPFWVQSRGEWVEAIALQPGDVLLDEQGNDILVTELAVTGQDLTAYNLTIEGIHTYYAGTQPTLVHNCPTGAGIYITDTSKGGIYVGQSVDPDRRLKQHVASGKISQWDADHAIRIEVAGGKTKREVAEQLAIGDFGGIEKLENKVNPIGDKRLHHMPEGYKR